MIENELIFATSNKHKLEEAIIFFGQYNINITQYVSQEPEIQSDYLEDIALRSAEIISKQFEAPIFVEDAGLFIKELNGFPGPYSSFVQRTIGNKGIIKLMADIKNREAFFKSVIAFSDGMKNKVYFTGITEGKIVEEERGTRLFGYDPIFIPLEGTGKTFAQMSAEEKNNISHRGKGLRAFVKWFIENK